VATTDDPSLDRDARRQLAFDRVVVERRTQFADDLDQQIYFKSWMSTRVAMPAMGREDVRLAQELLAQQGYDPGPIDGLYGPRTRAAVERFEQARGLPVTGTVSTGLIERLRLEA
jgi:peptidoglycan hydrolase-like protein with peptidoglycan-binding domain